MKQPSLQLTMVIGEVYQLLLHGWRSGVTSPASALDDFSCAALQKLACLSGGGPEMCHHRLLPVIGTPAAASKASAGKA